MDNVKLLSPSVLAFVGDAVYGLYVREALAEINRPSGELHKLSVKYVNAVSQSKAYKLIEGYLDEEELSVFKRGRNFHTNSSPKSATKGEYHIATGLECLFGYLHLSNNDKRATELFKIIRKSIEGEEKNET